VCGRRCRWPFEVVSLALKSELSSASALSLLAFVRHASIIHVYSAVLDSHADEGCHDWAIGLLFKAAVGYMYILSVYMFLFLCCPCGVVIKHAVFEFTQPGWALSLSFCVFLGCIICLYVGVCFVLP